MPRVEIQVVGPIEAVVDARSIDIGHARQRCVLAVLAVDANRAVSTDQLVDRLWGECPPQRAREVLHSYLSRLRKVLAPAGVHIARRHDGYALSVDPDVVDVQVFRSLCAQARDATTDADTLSLLEQALSLWRGPALGTWDSAWATDVRHGLDAERLVAELDRNDALLDLGRHADVVALVTARGLADSWDERLVGQKMLALYRCGRQADALSSYDALR